MILVVAVLLAQAVPPVKDRPPAKVPNAANVRWVADSFGNYTCSDGSRVIKDSFGNVIVVPGRR
jgi:hypothetical protein